MTPQELNRYKGQFIRGNPKRIKQPKPNDVVFFDTRFQVNGTGFSHNGQMPKRKGAL
jgi:hypothetical protein